MPGVGNIRIRDNGLGEGGVGGTGKEKGKRQEIKDNVEGYWKRVKRKPRPRDRLRKRNKVKWIREGLQRESKMENSQA